MKKFDFKLERLYRIRVHEENEWKIKLGKAVSDCVRIQNRIENCNNEIRRVLLNRGRIENRENDYFVMEMYKRKMAADIVKFSAELSEAEKKRELVRKEYMEYSKRKRIFEKLKEKREKEYYKEQKKAEHLLGDEVNNSRAAVKAMREEER